MNRHGDLRTIMKTGILFQIWAFPGKITGLVNATRMLVIATGAVITLLTHVQLSMAAPFAQTDCAVDEGHCEKSVQGLAVTFDLSPKPAAVMSELVFSVTLKDRGKAVNNAVLTLDISMPGMFMGNNVIRLASRGKGVYAGTGVIIRCPSGHNVWQATAVIKRGAKTFTVPFVFEVRR